MSKLQQFLDGTLPVNRKGQYLVEHATPVFCTEVLIRCIANNIKELAERPDDETHEEASLRFEINRDYVRVLDYIMLQMTDEIMPALQRLEKQMEKLQNPEDTEVEG